MDENFDKINECYNNIVKNNPVKLEEIFTTVSYFVKNLKESSSVESKSSVSFENSLFSNYIDSFKKNINARVEYINDSIKEYKASKSNNKIELENNSIFNSNIYFKKINGAYLKNFILFINDDYSTTNAISFYVYIKTKNNEYKYYTVPYNYNGNLKEVINYKSNFIFGGGILKLYTPELVEIKNYEDFCFINSNGYIELISEIQNKAYIVEYLPSSTSYKKTINDYVEYISVTVFSDTKPKMFFYSN